MANAWTGGAIKSVREAAHRCDEVVEAVGPPDRDADARLKVLPHEVSVEVQAPGSVLVLCGQVVVLRGRTVGFEGEVRHVGSPGEVEGGCGARGLHEPHHACLHTCCGVGVRHSGAGALATELKAQSSTSGKFEGGAKCEGRAMT